MFSSFNRSVLSPLVLGAILAGGVAVAWGFACELGYSTVVQLSRLQFREHLVITRDGRAVVEQLAIDDHSRRQFRSLEGQPITGTVESVYGANLAAAGIPRYESDGVSWHWRIAGISDTQAPPTLWYLVHDQKWHGRAYFGGYDSQSKLLVGYFAPGGFRPDLPPPDEQFPDVPVLGCAGIALSHGVQPGVSGVNWIATAAVFMISSGKLLALDLNRRSSRTVPEIDGAVSVATVRVPDDARPNGWDYRVAVRAAQRIYILDFAGTPLRSFAIPEALDGELLELHVCSEDVVVLQAYRPNRWDLRDLYWIDARGELREHQEVRLAQHAGPDPDDDWVLAAVAPLPLVMAFIAGIVMPLQQLGVERSPDYSQALAQSLSEVWPSLLAVCLLAAIVAVIGYRRQVRYGAPGAGAWAVLIFLLGPAGLAGYLLHRHWPVRAPCEHCGATVPQDREACLACATPFAPPALTGMEVFA